MKTGVILLNMGGPNNLNEVEVFLKNMFNDKNIITVKSSSLRSLIAFFIVTFRKKTAQKNYESIGGKSPIVAHTQKLVKKLQSTLNIHKIDFAMTYTPPFCDSAIKNLSKCEKLILLPLYPHYSTTTIKSALEDFEKRCKKLDVTFDVRVIKEFYKNEAYNRLLVSLIKDELKEKNASEYELIFSAHSLPQKIVDSGDVYQEQIKEHVKILSQMLKNDDIKFAKTHLAYQSKLGPVKWLEPELGQTLQKLAHKKVIVFPISFVIDNSETEFELHMEYKKEAKEHGIKEYKVARCPNDKDEFVEVLRQLILNA